MIRDIISVLYKMELACPIECFPFLRASDAGNLILEWRWDHDGTPGSYSRMITPECDEVMIDHCIEVASHLMHARMQ